MKKHTLTLEQKDDIVKRSELTQADFDAINEDIFPFNDKPQTELSKQNDQHQLEQSLLFKKYKHRLTDLLKEEGSNAPCGHLTPNAPTANRGGKSQIVQNEVMQLIQKNGFIEDIKGLIAIDGEAKAIPNDIPAKPKTAFIDYVNFTTLDKDFIWDDQPVSDDHLMEQVSLVMTWIFGFHITSKRATGANFYKNSYDCISTDGIKYALVCQGGQKDTVLISVSGEGCHAARLGWEQRLFKFLNLSTQGRITRIDLAYDDPNGLEFTVDSMEQGYDKGDFNMGGRNPDIELRGNWKNPNGKGRTVYVGNRSNGKYLRCYEKGKQLGNPDSNWVRVEVELKSKDRHLPYDILLKPAQYMAAQYPVLNFISQEQSRIATVSNTVKTSYSRMTTWLKHQCGSALNVMLQIEGDPKKVLDLIVRQGKTPRGLSVPDFNQMADKYFSTRNNFSPVFGTF